MYKFNLEFLLQYRRQKEEAEMYELANRVRRVNQIESELEDIKVRAAELKESAKKKGRTEISGPILELYSAYIQQLRILRSSTKQVLAEAESRVEDQRQNLTRVAVDRKIVDRLKEIMKEAYLTEEARKELKMLDEAAVIKAGRKQNEKSA